MVNKKSKIDDKELGPCKLIVSIAKQYELSTGIVLHQILFWCLVNEAYNNKAVFYKNRYWTFLSLSKIYENLQGIISQSTIVRAIALLVKENLILKEYKSNGDSYSGCLYAITDKCFDILNAHSELSWVKGEVNSYIKNANGKKPKQNKKKQSNFFAQLSLDECTATTDITKLSKLSRVNEPLDANAFI